MSYLRRILAVLGIGIAAAGPSTSTQPADPSKQWDATPDAPVSFGYKVCWLTIRTQDTAAVIRAMRLRDARAANWKTGISAAYEENLVFVSPVLHGWTFVVGRDLPPPESNGPGEPAGGLTFGHMFAKLSEQFPEVQFFGSHRVSGFVAWARAKGGHVERVFSFVKQTGRDPLPDEHDVVDLARAWSGIDPTQLEQGHFDTGAGTVGLLPAATDPGTP
jgi:hypothetical protein